MPDALLLLASLLWSAFFTGAEMGAYQVNRVRLRFRSRLRFPGAAALHALVSDRQVLVATTLVGTNLGHYGATAVLGGALNAAGVPHAELWSTVALAPVILVVAELVPKAVFAAHANHLMYRIAPAVRAATFVFYPFVLALKGIMAAFDRLLGKSEPQGLGLISLPRLRHFIEEGTHEGVISPEQDRMARNVMQLERVRLRDVMVPLERVAAVPRNIRDAELRDLARQCPYSRFPVYEREKADIVGVLPLVEYLSEVSPSDPDRPAPLDRFIRPLPRLHDTLHIDAALLALRRARTPMGVVTTSAGRAVGIVTIKDLVEEIVGELAAW